MTTVNVAHDGPIAVFELSRPRSGNALDSALVEELRSAFDAIEPERTRAVVLAGAGRHFCAGADLEELGRTVEAGFDDSLAEARRLGDLYAAVLRAPVATAAAVSGAAYGGGAGLAAACDLVVAGPSARFQFSELRLGFVPALISVFLPRRIRPAALGRLFLDPAPLDAVAAVAAGLADEQADDPRAAAAAWCLSVARKTAPSAVAATRRLLLDLDLPDLEARLETAARVNAEQRAHPECRRGVAEFFARRAFADWTES